MSTNNNDKLPLNDLDLSKSKNSNPIFDSEVKDHILLRRLNLYSYFSFFLWPILFYVAIFTGIYKLIRKLLKKTNWVKAKSFKINWYFIILPFNLLLSAIYTRNIKIFMGLILLMPFMIFTILSLFSTVFHNDISSDIQILQSPGYIFPFGTNAGGMDVLKLIISGAQHTYLTSAFATFFVLITGIWMGALTIKRPVKKIIMGLVEIIETIPILFILLILMAVFSWWEDVMKKTVFEFLIPIFRIFILGLGIGIGFLPRMIRLIEEKIKTFVNLDFVDGTKSHGIHQKRIVWFHIIKKNCMEDIILTGTQIWASVILIEISLDYLISISPILGAKIYESWAGMLLVPETKDAIINYLAKFDLQNWWLYFFPGGIILITIMGFYIFGDGLKTLYQKKTFTCKNVIGQASKIFYGLDEKLRLLK